MSKLKPPTHFKKPQEKLNEEANLKNEAARGEKLLSEIQNKDVNLESKKEGQEKA